MNVLKGQTTQEKLPKVGLEDGRVGVRDFFRRFLKHEKEPKKKVLASIRIGDFTFTKYSDDSEEFKKGNLKVQGKFVDILPDGSIIALMEREFTIYTPEGEEIISASTEKKRFGCYLLPVQGISIRICYFDFMQNMGHYGFYSLSLSGEKYTITREDGKVAFYRRDKKIDEGVLVIPLFTPENDFLIIKEDGRRAIYSGSEKKAEGWKVWVGRCDGKPTYGEVPLTTL